MADVSGSGVQRPHAVSDGMAPDPPGAAFCGIGGEAKGKLYEGKEWQKCEDSCPICRMGIIQA